jgi:hypothetical protein
MFHVGFCMVCVRAECVSGAPARFDRSFFQRQGGGGTMYIHLMRGASPGGDKRK